jgi:RES domain-containing protein
VTVHRVCKAKYPKNDGVGSAISGNRWNHKDTAMIYCAATASLCMLEVLVHSDTIPRDMVTISVDIPEDVAIETISDAMLPPDWNAAIPSAFD